MPVFWGLGRCYESKENWYLNQGKSTPLYQGRSLNFTEGNNLTTRIEESVASRERKGVECFLLIDNLVFESVLYKGKSKILFLFEIVLRLHKVQMRIDLILNSIHIAGRRIIESGIYGNSKENKLGGMIRGLYPFVICPGIPRSGSKISQVEAMD